MVASPVLRNTAPDASLDSAFERETRQFRRLEVTLPVWITTESAFKEGLDVWELGYTRDISLGGAKVIVPAAEEPQWRKASSVETAFVVRFEGDESQAPVTKNSVIYAFVRHVGRETGASKGKDGAINGQLSLGVQFTDAARPAREAALRAGLATQTRRVRWQLACLLAIVLSIVTFLSVRTLQAQNRVQQAQIAALQGEASKIQQRIAVLQKPTLVSTKSEGVDAGFQQAEAEQALAQLNSSIAKLAKKPTTGSPNLAQLRQNIARLNNPKNMDAANAQRNKDAQALGLSLAPTSTQARVQFAIAFPYGYNWPLVLNDLETALNRKVPHVVVFRDWSMGFPDLDAREARARGKTLQVTWEPWHFSNPRAVRLSDIVSGKYDKYIDAWAAGARAFGGEIWVRWGHEMNGNWYPWSLANTGQSPQLWKAAYTRIHDRFRRAGAFNVRWIWCVNAESVPAASWNNAFATYPGDDKVDAVAVDGYNFGTTTAHSRWQSFSQIFAAPYSRLIKEHPNKPVFVAETGCATTGGDKARWLRDMDVALRGPFAKVESVTWFEAAKEADWRLLSSEDTARLARQIFGNAVYRRGAG